MHSPTNLRSVNGESFGHLPRDDTENEDLRGVIDDLTVENKRLKHLLKTTPVNKNIFTPDSDKAFEIRMHGLPPDKKRELEQLLKAFTLGITPASPSTATDPNEPANNQGSSKLKFTSATPSAIDSAYASKTTSAVDPASNSGYTRISEPVTHSNRDREIKDYLHDIPNSLLPQGTLAIDENAKMRLVVQRLEQLFLGTSAVPGEHSLPIQQEKISRSAARADRREGMKNNRTMGGNGSREAMMLPQDTRMVLDAPEHDREQVATNAPAKDRPESGSTPDAAGVSEDSSPSQRPTRPLDLDIERAQVVEDNITYIRHLGFTTPPDSQPNTVRQQPWIFLNLLVGMAQLHTLNVTPAFTRKALKTLSTRFEISEDEQKIRWKGSSDESVRAKAQQSPNPPLRSVSDDMGDETGGRSKRSATSTLNEQSIMSNVGGRAATSGNSKSLHSSNSTLPTAGPPSNPSRVSAFDYKPIVYQGKRSHVTRSYLDSPSLSDGITPRSRRSGRGSGPLQPRPKHDSHEGVVTFFNHSYFCEDQSGDADSINMKSERSLPPSNVLGLDDTSLFVADNLRDSEACYFQCEDQSEDQAEEYVGEQWSELDMPLNPITCAGEDETRPLEFAASGIGGVKPEENFALDVKIARSRLPIVPRSKTPVWTASSLGKKLGSCFNYQVVGCEKLDLRPSQLPPPSYVLFTSSSTSGADDELCSSSASDASSEADESPAPAGYMWQWTSSSQEILGDEDDSDSDSDSDGILMSGVMDTPQVAVGNSAQMRAQEHDLTAFQAQRTRSGSLAATVGASGSAASVADHHGGV